MAILSVSQLKKSFSTRLLFEGVCFEVSGNDRIGLVGVNGSGKSTLFSLLAGADTPDSGSIYRSRGMSICTMEQTMQANGLTLYEATLGVFSRLLDMERELSGINQRLTSPCADMEKLILRQSQLSEQYEFFGGLTFKNRTRSTLLGLGFTQQELEKPIEAMSGGQRGKAQLARVLLSGADLLLLDEPTNHLDIAAINWLEDFLLSRPGAYIVISHDRYFLDKVTNRTMELKNCRLTVSAGNYSRHLELVSSEQESIRRKYNKTQREIRRLNGVVEQQRRWGQAHNFVTAASKLKQIERLKATLTPPEKDTEAIRFTFHTDEHSGNDVLICKELKKSYGTPVFENASLHIRKGERVFLLGPNGCGKTTLLRIVTGREEPDAGSIELGAGVSPGYYEQHMAGLSGSGTVLEELRNAYPRLSDTRLRNALGAFLFRGDDVHKELDMLSGGEKARVQLLKLMLSSANLLLLDEPTNHLDIASREALEGALEDYEGTMLVVTHDRYLVNRLADRVLSMNENGILEYIGGYDDYLAAAAGASQPDRQEKAKQPNEYKLRKQLENQLNLARGELGRAEQRIADAEAKKQSYLEWMATPEVAADHTRMQEHADRLAAMDEEISRLYTAWEAADQKVQELEAGMEPAPGS